MGFREGVWIPGGASDCVGGRECGFQGGGVDLGGRRERAWTLTERRSEYKLGGTKLRTRTLEQVESPGRPGCFVQVPGDILSGRVPVASRPGPGLVTLIQRGCEFGSCHSFTPL